LQDIKAAEQIAGKGSYLHASNLVEILCCHLHTNDPATLCIMKRRIYGDVANTFGKTSQMARRDGQNLSMHDNHLLASKQQVDKIT
jgi:hypothetical protein